MRLTAAALNIALDGLSPSLDYLSLHSAYPSSTGANEIASGTFPGYARGDIPGAGAWSAASGAVLTHTPTVTFTFTAGTNGRIDFMGYFSAIIAGTFYGFNCLGGKRAFVVQGDTATAAEKFTYDDIDDISNGLANDVEIYLRTLGQHGSATGPNPTPGDFPTTSDPSVQAATRYFVVTKTAAGATGSASFQIAATSGGAPLTLSADGKQNYMAQVVVPETISASGGQLAITTKNIRLSY